MPHGKNKHVPKGLEILHEDDDVIVFEKAEGILSCDIRNGTRYNAEAALTDYVRKGVAKSSKRAWLVHRLDRETSGVMVFAKSLEMRDALQAAWDKTEKRYLAAVRGTFAQKRGLLENWLVENDDLFVHCVPREIPGAKFARTDYTVLAEKDGLSLLDVRLLTGRKHQIRVQFAERGHPVVGDPKYGRHDPYRARLVLHARSLSFPHPRTGRRLTFLTSVPPCFQALFGVVPALADAPAGASRD